MATVKKKATKAIKLPEELEDTKKIGPNLRIKFETLSDGKEYLVTYSKVDVKGEASKTGRSVILSRTERFAKLQENLALNMVLTRKETN